LYQNIDNDLIHKFVNMPSYKEHQIIWEGIANTLICQRTKCYKTD